jgi:hypothetical protein
MFAATKSANVESVLKNLNVKFACDSHLHKIMAAADYPEFLKPIACRIVICRRN